MEHSIPAHPEGVEPQGQLFVEPESVRVAAATFRRAGLGVVARLDDALIVAALEHLDETSLATLAGASRVFGAFARFDELWKARCLRRSDGGLLPPWRGSWHATVVAARGGAADAPRPRPPARLFSDVLYRPHLLAHSPSPFGAAPKGPAVRRVRDFSKLDRAAFRERFEADGGSPVVLEGLGEDAVASGAWTAAALEARYGDRVYHAGGVNFRLADYLRYGASNADDPPFYVFDPTVGASTPELLAHYAVPEYFQDDLFDLLDDAERPDYRWLLLGGPRSGQSWHTDPNSTSAWNLTLEGSKRWLFFPPTVTPPGVRPSVDGDGDNYLAPVSNAEWARAGFYEECAAHPRFLECQTKPGDVVYVPRGWWHMVLNLAPVTVAVSHHFVSPSGLPNVLKRLRDTPEHVSGVERHLGDDDRGPKRARTDGDKRAAAGSRLHDALVAALERERPGALADAEAVLARAAATARPRWRSLVPEAKPAAFAFSFA
ncbi:hypothetical protein AURANDRAFT_26320 [Aureococcus anophagefferens]|uniref:JmjC domain-containing protein n=1 Tax=Aureococcus anophagefferens TaxID=44056 RepID=F0Y9C8_AURAN|nr:hypothetical protein AURANDRAFT_26320 [Aureococcus anophagefferens]EGB08361.1 hypothetical protein AURANDRAFT_26320 [Aureococcus anophagefferens]|eukprot:XP_009037081.1 hypothetical protein AURANDRAFT_26320 [Aureococcus anophagefferens]